MKFILLTLSTLFCLSSGHSSGSWPSASHRLL